MINQSEGVLTLTVTSLCHHFGLHIQSDKVLLLIDQIQMVHLDIAKINNVQFEKWKLDRSILEIKLAHCYIIKKNKINLP